MTFLRALLRPSEERAITSMQLWGTGADPYYTPIHAGVAVTQDTALKFSVVYACIKLMGGTVASLPADVYRQKDEASQPMPPPLWMRQPNPSQTWFDFIEYVNGSLDLDGNAFALITARDAGFYPAELHILDPRKVRVTRERGYLEYVYGEKDRYRQYTATTPAGDVLHIRNFASASDRSPSPIDIAGQAIGLGLVAEKFAARFFGTGQTLSGVIEIPQPPPEKQRKDFIDALKQGWMKDHAGSDRAHLPGVLFGGSWKPTAVPPENAQMLETRKFQIEEICRVFGTPPHLVSDIDRSTSWGTGIEQQSIGFVQYSVLPRVKRLETALSQLVPRGQYVKWSINGLLRGDTIARGQFYAAGRQWGYLGDQDIRRLEDMPPIMNPDGTVAPNTFLTPVNMTSSGDATPAPDASEPALVGS